MRHMQSILLATNFQAGSVAAADVARQLAGKFGSAVTVVHAIEPVGSSAIVYAALETWAQKQMSAYVRRLLGQRVRVADVRVVSGPAADGILQTAVELDADLILLGVGEQKAGECMAAGPVAAAVMQHARQPVLGVRPGQPVPTFRRVLCPVDASPVAARGLRNAIRLVKAFSGELLVLTVVPEVSWLSAAVETGSWSQALVEHDQRWREGFEEFLKKQDFGDIRWSPEIRGGDPARQIVAAAADFACDALVMGATGRSGLLHVLMGSVTRRVLQHLPCSVLTVHDEDMLLEELTEADVRTNNLLYVEAKALLETQAYEAALVKFDQVLARNPFHVPALEGRAEACEHLGQSERAERCRRRAVVLRHETWV